MSQLRQRGVLLAFASAALAALLWMSWPRASQAPTSQEAHARRDTRPTLIAEPGVTERRATDFAPAQATSDDARKPVTKAYPAKFDQASAWNTAVPGLDLRQIDATLTDLLAAAASGRPVAFRHLARLTALCQRADNEPHDGERARARFDEMHANGDIDAELHAMFHEHATVCGAVQERVPSRDWFSLGRKAGDPVLLLLEAPYAGPMLPLTREGEPAGTTKEAVVAAARTLDPVVLRTIGLWTGGDGEDFTPDELTRFLAWDVFACRVDPGCDDGPGMAILEQDFFPYEKEAILAEATALEGIVRAGRLADHDLETNARTAP